MNRKPKPDMLDADNPEWTTTDFANARPAADVLPALFGETMAASMLKSKGGRPKKESPKISATVRFDPEIFAYFKAKGKGWQTRMNEALKEYVATH